MPSLIKFPKFISVLLFLTVFLAACASQPGTPVTSTDNSGSSATTSTGSTSPTDQNNSATPTIDTAAATPTIGSAENVPAGAVSFSKDILPMLQNSCVSCHGGEKTSKGLDMKTYASLILGSQNGAVIVAGDPAGSKLIQSVQSGKMPKRGAKLTPEQIQLLIDWVNAGALEN